MKISILISAFVLVSLLIVNSSSGHRMNSLSERMIDSLLNRFIKRSISWQGNWALACDFPGNDLANAQMRGEDCGGACARKSGCTHFTWTKYNGGTCWTKQGSISKNNARFTNDNSMVCGVADDSSRNAGLGALLHGVLATRHAAHESGACALPAASYAVTNPVALGSIESLKHLKFQPDLCGHVLRVDCGHGPLNIIITNSNYGGGLDLYASTWEKLTNKKPPGETSCNVQLTSDNAFNFNEVRCYYKPGTDFGNAYYHNVGLLNTNGRKVIRATIDNRPGEHRGDNPYYAFNFGPIDGNKQIIFTFDGGSTHTVYLRDCEYKKNEQYWS